NALTPGLSVSLLGSAAIVNNVRPYPAGNPFIALDVVPTLPRFGPEHLLFNTPGNVYVRPSAFSVVVSPPPVISAVAPTVDSNGNAAVAITGEEFNSTTQVFFDGVPAVVEGQTGTQLVVTPPFAPIGYTAAVAAFNADGQSSLFLNPTAPTYTYDGSLAPAASANPVLIVRPGVLAAGGPITVDVQAAGTNFQQGVTAIGFGTSDVTVGEIKVLSPTHLTVSVTPNVAISMANITITTGLQVISQAVGSSVTPADTQQQ
ncbi:MAG TPA: IPT/TIG domain-containing protein, partial [Bryobacteraceae bacterium]|nr:IPT/TIG domain-containing protein [Bryobacteraceae bacterium]